MCWDSVDGNPVASRTSMEPTVKRCPGPMASDLTLSITAVGRCTLSRSPAAGLQC